MQVLKRVWQSVVETPVSAKRNNSQEHSNRIPDLDESIRNIYLQGALQDLVHEWRQSKTRPLLEAQEEVQFWQLQQKQELQQRWKYLLSAHMLTGHIAEAYAMYRRIVERVLSHSPSTACISYEEALSYKKKLLQILLDALFKPNSFDIDVGEHLLEAFGELELEEWDQFYLQEYLLHAQPSEKTLDYYLYLLIYKQGRRAEACQLYFSRTSGFAGLRLSQWRQGVTRAEREIEDVPFTSSAFASIKNSLTLRRFIDREVFMLELLHVLPENLREDIVSQDPELVYGPYRQHLVDKASSKKSNVGAANSDYTRSDIPNATPMTHRAFLEASLRPTRIKSGLIKSSLNRESVLSSPNLPALSQSSPSPPTGIESRPSPPTGIESSPSNTLSSTQSSVDRSLASSRKGSKKSQEQYVNNLYDENTSHLTENPSPSTKEAAVYPSTEENSTHFSDSRVSLIEDSPVQVNDYISEANITETDIQESEKETPLNAIEEKEVQSANEMTLPCDTRVSDSFSTPSTSHLKYDPTPPPSLLSKISSYLTNIFTPTRKRQLEALEMPTRKVPRTSTSMSPASSALEFFEDLNDVADEAAFESFSARQESSQLPDNQLGSTSKINTPQASGRILKRRKGPLSPLLHSITLYHDESGKDSIHTARKVPKVSPSKSGSKRKRHSAADSLPLTMALRPSHPLQEHVCTEEFLHESPLCIAAASPAKKSSVSQAGNYSPTKKSSPSRKLSPQPTKSSNLLIHDSPVLPSTVTRRRRKKPVPAIMSEDTESSSPNKGYTSFTESSASASNGLNMSTPRKSRHVAPDVLTPRRSSRLHPD